MRGEIISKSSKNDFIQQKACKSNEEKDDICLSFSMIISTTWNILYYLIESEISRFKKAGNGIFKLYCPSFP